MSYCKCSQSTITYFSGEPIQVVVFQLFAPLLDTLLLDTNILICAEQINNQLANASGVTPLLQEIIGHMEGKKFCLDELDRLYLTSKSYELLFHLYHNVIGKGQCPLATNQAKAVDRAVRMIQEHLETPLSLEQIAREAGVCATGLNAGFKETFGTTVFGYIRQQRLARAKELMKYQGKTVSEAAWESGYQSLSSFAIRCGAGFFQQKVSAIYPVKSYPRCSGDKSSFFGIASFRNKKDWADFIQTTQAPI